MKSRVFKRAAVAVVGGVVLLVGLVTIPYPGPGWLIVFAGLGILSTEFDWAKRVLAFTRAKYDEWQDWLKRQPILIKSAFWVVTCIVVVTTIWLLNGYGLLNAWLHLGVDWLESPLVK